MTEMKGEKASLMKEEVTRKDEECILYVGIGGGVGVRRGMSGAKTYVRVGKTEEGLLAEPMLMAAWASSRLRNMNLNLPTPQGVVAMGLIGETLKSERSSIQVEVVKTAMDLSLSFSLEVQSILS